MLNYSQYKDCFEGYAEYKDFVDSGGLERIDEGIIPDAVKDKVVFLKDLADAVGRSVSELANLLVNRDVFGFMKAFGFSVKRLFDAAKEGFKYVSKIGSSLSKYLKEKGITKYTDRGLEWVDGFLEENPWLKKVGGIAAAGVLVYVWLNLISFTGDPDFDFDISSILSALKGNFTLYDLFGGDNGMKMLIFIATNQALGLTFPWPGASSIQFIFAVAYTLAKKAKDSKLASYLKGKFKK